MNTHGKVVCRKCAAVVAQCRCIEGHKNVTYVDTCSKCNNGKVIEKTEHPDGRQSVTVHVNSLDLNEPTDEDLIAQDIIETKVLQKIGEMPVLVTVIHKESLKFAVVKTTLMNVRKVAQQLIKGFPSENTALVDPSEFIVVENQGDEVRVTHL